MRRPTFQLSRNRLIGAAKVAAIVTAIFVVIPLLGGEAPRLGVVLPMFPLMLIIAYRAWPALEPSFGNIGKQRALEAVGVVALSLVVVIASTNVIVLLTGMQQGYAILIFFGASLLAYAGYQGFGRYGSRHSRAEHSSV